MGLEPFLDGPICCIILHDLYSNKSRERARVEAAGVIIVLNRIAGLQDYVNLSYIMTVTHVLSSPKSMFAF